MQPAASTPGRDGSRRLSDAVITVAPESGDGARPRVRRRLNLATRLAILTAALAVALVLSATEISLSLSQSERLDDYRDETVALANTLATFLMRVAPTGDP